MYGGDTLNWDPFSEEAPMKKAIYKGTTKALKQD